MEEFQINYISLREENKNPDIHGINSNIIELFEKCVLDSTENIALIHENEELSYYELNLKANRLAANLLEEGIEKEGIVCVSYADPIKMIVSILGVLKAGGAYLPIDPSNPTERKKFILVDSQAKFLITDDISFDNMIDNDIIKINIELDEFSDEISNPILDISANNLAYVIYTSGSSGSPKGVLIEHKSLINLLNEFEIISPTFQGAKYSLWSNFSFDVSVYEVFSSLLHGGTLHIIPEKIKFDSYKIIEWLKDNKITHSYLPNFILSDLTDQVQNKGEQFSLSRVLVGVEPIPQKILETIALSIDGICIINGYGPTEATICSTLYPFKNPLNNLLNTPIGKPLTNTEVIILNCNLSPVAIGEVGEIFIAGLGLARGYLNRLELNKEKFIKLKVKGYKYEVFYRSGDLGKYLPDGNIVFIGREDRQLKLRGFRVELEEIEKVIMALPNVLNVHVMVRNDITNSKQIVAYIVSDSDFEISAVKKRISKILPPYMIPEYFELLNNFPLTENGKINTAKLPKPSRRIAKTIETETIFLNNEEKIISEIWSEVLVIEYLNVTQSFYELGGNSLLATQIISRINKAFNILFPFKSFFENPSIEKQAKYISKLNISGNTIINNEIKVQNRRSNLPLSFSQERAWFLNQLAPKNLAYNFQSLGKMKGHLDINALKQSLQDIVNRHELLRTSFSTLDGKPVQVIHPYFPIHIEEINIEHIPANDQQYKVEKLINQTIKNTHFDLNKLPLIKWFLFKLNLKEHILLQVEHHIIHDGWSYNIFLKELSEFYKKNTLGLVPNIDKLTIQFADYASWEREFLPDITHAQLPYWEKKLANLPDILELPTSKPRLSKQTFNGAIKRYPLPEKLCNYIRAFSSENEVTLFMVLLAAFKGLLYRYTSRGDIVIGSGIANRRNRSTENLIGMMVNNVLLRTSLTEDMNFKDLLKEVRNNALEAYENQEVPFEKIVKTLNLDRNSSFNPLFQIMFSFHDSTLPKLDFPNLNVEFQEGVSNGSAKFDLNVVVLPRHKTTENNQNDTGITLVWEYNTDLFEEEAMDNMLLHYENILRDFMAYPTKKIAYANMLSNDEKNLLLGNRSNLQPTLNSNIISPSQTLHGWFENIVKSHPDAIAISSLNEKITYSELNSKSNQIARYLLNSNVKSGDLISICLDKSADMIIGILGILKAGCTYVPLDPSQAKERLSFIIEDTQCTHLLTYKVYSHLFDLDKMELTFLDQSSSQILNENDIDLELEIDANRLAYIIYTSGSTGKPKGVTVTHLNINNLFKSTDSIYKFNNNDVWTLFHSFAFDFSVWEIWGALLYGGKLILVNYETSRSPSDFYKLLLREKVTVLNQTPTAFNQLINESKILDEERLTLKHIIFGGEELNTQILAPWIEKFGDSKPKLINMYGITEASVHVTYKYITKKDLNLANGSNIGRAIPGQHVYILDKNLQPVPFGIPGELYISGAGVTAGYHNNQNLTNDRFIPNPFIKGDKYKIYKSGDIGYYQNDGDLIYLGRMDEQVNLRGFRIELGDIRNNLLKFPGIKSVYIKIFNDVAHKKIVAYLITKDGSLDPNDLRLFLKDHLPDYMIPSNFISLPKFPITNNGKIDEKSLPHPYSINKVSPDTVRLSLTKNERILHDAWKKVLSLRVIDTENNFFSLGGDSIRIIQVLSEVEKNGISFSVSDFFQNQTIKDLAKKVITIGEIELKEKDEILISKEDKERLPINIENAYPLTALQSGILYHKALSPKTAVFQNIAEILIQGSYNDVLFKKALYQLIDFHPILRTSFDLTSYSEPLQLVNEHVNVSFEYMNLMGFSPIKQKEELNCKINSEKHKEFDITTAPLFRFNIINLNSTNYIVVLTFNHVLFDGWSLASFIEALHNLYNTYINNNLNDVYLEPLQVSFSDYVSLEKQTLKSIKIKEYWKEKLSDVKITRIPSIKNPSLVDSERDINNFELEIEHELSIKLSKLVKDLKIPLKTALLAVHLRVMNVVSGETDVLTGLVLNGRLTIKDGEKSLGIFLNTVPFRQIMEIGSWKELLINTFKNEQEIFPNRRYPLNQIQQDIGNSNLIQTAFNFNHFHVYDKERQSKDVKIIDVKEHSETNFPFLAGFIQNPSNDYLRMKIQYDSNLYSKEQITNISNYYINAIKQVVNEDINTGIYLEKSILANNEYNQLINDWSISKNNSLLEKKHFIENFQETVKNHPNRIALKFDDEELSYSHLEVKSNQLAHFLKNQGVKKNSLVGIFLPRSIDFVVALIGVLKAGGTYIPLDTSYPSTRISHILEETAISVLITNADFGNNINLKTLKNVYIDKEWLKISRESRNSLNTDYDLNQFAYILYTSGSTGRPKGVQITHFALANYLNWCRYKYSINSSTKSLFHSPVGFDLSITSLFPILLAGGEVSILNENLNIDQFSSNIQLDKYSLLKITPSHLKILNKVLHPLINLNTIIIGGENLDWEDIIPLRDIAPNSNVFNEYGPTEATVGVSVYQAEKNSSHTFGSVPIGTPIINTRLYILDQSMQPVPIGTPGELYIGGDSLSTGYLKQKNLTNEKFVKDPFSNEDFLIYKSGDLAKHLPNGDILYLGRLDEQIKVRGYRVEPDEIKNLLKTHPFVYEAMILVTKNATINAYITSSEKSIKNEDIDLKKYLNHYLPHYMIPQNIIVIDSFPLTLNGKVDTGKLLLKTNERKDFINYHEPRNAREKIVQNILTNVLGIENISIYDDFFSLGMHSLSAMQIINNLSKEFDIDLQLSLIFRNPTIIQISEELSMLKKKSNNSSSICIAPVSRINNKYNR